MAIIKEMIFKNSNLQESHNKIKFVSSIPIISKYQPKLFMLIWLTGELKFPKMILSSKVMQNNLLKILCKKFLPNILLYIIVKTIMIIWCHLRNLSKYLILYWFLFKRNELEINVLAGGMQSSIKLQFKKAIDLNNIE